MTRGIRDSRNRDSLWYADAKDVVPGEYNRYRFPTLPTEHTFKAGHQIAIIVAGTNTSQASSNGSPNNVAVTLDARTSKVTLPIVGGAAALQAAGAFNDMPVGGTVPPTLSVSLGAPASFGAFTPGVARDYFASTTATVTSSAGNAALIVQDPSPFHTNHLVNGSFALAQPLQAKAANGTYGSLPTGIRFWGGPTAGEQVPIEFKQSIGASEALRTGSYGKTLTFTLSTTSP